MRYGLNGVGMTFLEVDWLSVYFLLPAPSLVEELSVSSPGQSLDHAAFQVF